MAYLKDRWLSLIDEYSAETTNTLVIELPAENSPPVVPIVPKVDISEVKSADVATAPNNGLPIYEATAKEINFWHANAPRVFLQALLRDYQLDISSPNVAAHNYFKVGFDTKAHRATFALDDIHYLAIEFNQWNSAPLDKTQARLVLEKICAIRIATRRFKTFCGVQIEYFD